MKMRLRACAAAAAAALPIGTALAATIPIEIRWAGTQPSSINISTAGGLQPLTYDSQGQVYRGTISIASATPQRRTVIISYGTFNHPIDLRVHSVLPAISFGVEHRPQASCTSNKVKASGEPSSNLVDALNRAVAAGQLLSIESPNDCGPALRPNAAQARYRQNVRMSQLSQGLFLINEQIKQEYQELAGLQQGQVAAEIAAYAQAEARLEAVQLIAARDNAQEARDFVSAAAISNYVEERIAADPAARETFAREGITADRAASDSRFLDALATQQAMTAPNE
jgi:hypothetical protein